MLRSFCPSNCKFVYSKNEFGYQEVLDSFFSAKEITIVTYNISESENHLMSALRNAGEHCKVNILTNIPNRWEEYYAQWCRDKAKKKIDLYLTMLKPEKLGPNASVFFHFSNHSKIIMTNSIVYVGSENFSAESVKNSECGFISSDSEFISFIKSEILPELEKCAVPYYEYDYTSLILEANLAVAAVFNAKNRLYDEVYRLSDHRGRETYYYIDSEALLSVQTLNHLNDVMDDANKIASDIYDAIGVILDQGEWNYEDSEEVEEIYKMIGSHAGRILDIQEFKSIVELSEFDEQDYIDRQLQDDYAMEAHDEYLEGCIEEASDNATDKIYDLAYAAKDDIDELLAEIDSYCGAYAAIINNLQTRKVQKRNPLIDNT